MDVKNFFAFSVVTLTLTACSSQKNTNTVTEPLNKQGTTCASSAISTSFIVRWEDGRVTLEHSESKDKFIQDFVEPNLQDIKRVEYDYKLKLQPTVQIETSAFESFNTWGQDMVQAQAVWNAGVTGAGVKVAVVDTGLDYDHVQLKNQLAKNNPEINGVAGVDDDGNGFIDDFYGWDFSSRSNKPNVTGVEHGSHVAGIIAGEHGSGMMKGIAPNATIVPSSFLDESGGTVSGAIEAIKYAASRGVRIINASWGGDQCSEELKESIAELGSQNILFVAAAGNEGIDFDYMPESYWSFPAAFDFVHQITVAWSTQNDYVSYYSNRSGKLVHLSAPGDYIWSTTPNNSYKSLSGTSMAAPFVSGAAALLWSDRPQASAVQIRQAILESVDVDSTKAQHVVTGGRLNVEKALAKLRQLLP